MISGHLPNHMGCELVQNVWVCVCVCVCLRGKGGDDTNIKLCVIIFVSEFSLLVGSAATLM